MKPVEKPEDFIRRGKAKAATDSQFDKRVLDDSFVAMEQAVARRSRPRILRSRTVKFAAAVIIIAAGLLVIPSRQPHEEPPTGKVAESPVRMLSAMSLNMAYRKGGIEAVDSVSAEAFEALGAAPAKASMRELLTGLNGV
ncbi:MAG: hypothetical protein ACYS8Z_08770 [Planctomycetota bacterium]|jgi:hypothetical protein